MSSFQTMVYPRLAMPAAWGVVADYHFPFYGSTLNQEEFAVGTLDIVSMPINTQ